MKPTLGRIVLYRAHGSPNGQHQPAQRAAVITEVHSETEVGLCVLNPTGIFFGRSELDPEGLKPGSWSWPPRV